jgi:hypothetical protein
MMRTKFYRRGVVPADSRLPKVGVVIADAWGRLARLKPAMRTYLDGHGSVDDICCGRRRRVGMLLLLRSRH